jgi:primosomal protein N' (replication factor Y)
VARVVPSLIIRRFDSDKREDLSELLAGEPGVLVATTACLRHPPLPNVSLVAVTLLDAFLSLGDFRAEEAAFRLLLNLAELAPGRRPLTLIQTFSPESPLLQAYTQGAGEAFVAELLARREAFHYPPFAALAKVQLSAREASTAERAAVWLAGALRAGGRRRRGAAGAERRTGRADQGAVQLSALFAYHGAAARRALAPALAYRGAARLRIDIDPRDVSGFLE